MSIYHQAPLEHKTPPATGLFSHCYCICQQGAPYVAMCGHVETDEPRWRNGIPEDTCCVCIDLQWTVCRTCGLGPV